MSHLSELVNTLDRLRAEWNGPQALVLVVSARQANVFWPDGEYPDYVLVIDTYTADLSHLNGRCPDLFVVDEVFGRDEIPAAKPYIHSATRRGKGERKRNKAERWR